MALLAREHFDVPSALGAGNRSPAAPIALAVLAVLAGAAGLVATDPSIWPAAALVLAIPVTAVLLVRHARVALMLAFFIVVAAITKFRVREATALLEGDFDGQVIFELASYAAALVIVVVNACLYTSRRTTRAVPVLPSEALLGVYVALTVTSALWAADARVTEGRALQLIILFALSTVAVRSLGSRQALRTLTIAVVAYVLLASSMALVFPWASYTYIPGFFSWFYVHPGVAGTCAGIGAVLLLSGMGFSRDSKAASRVRWAIVIAFVLVLIGTHERTPILAFIAGALAMWAQRCMRPLLAAVVLCTVFVALAVGLHAVGSLYDQTELASGNANPVVVYLLRGQSGEEFLRLTGRVDLWEYISTLIQERPFLGYGYLASRSLLLERFPWAGSSHGTVPEVLLNLGFTGAALLAWVVIRTMATAFIAPAWAERDGSARQRAAVFGMLVFLLVAGVGGDSFAGPPGVEVFVFLVVVLAHEHQRMLDIADRAPTAST